MNFAYPMQQFQDWLTQQWVIFRGKRIEPCEVPWLIGPFGNLGPIDEDFIQQFARKEGLLIDKETNAGGLIPSMRALQLPEQAFAGLSRDIIDFYEHTANYSLDLSIRWNPFFKIFGVLLQLLFSNRIKQLNIPTRQLQDNESLKSEIITLTDPKSGQVKYTFWLRSVRSSGLVIYSGAYGISTLPSGETCIKAVFPLPNGNATVFLRPSCGINGELILDSSGRKFGDAGFYFLLRDAKGNYWSQFIRSFRNRLIVSSEDKDMAAEQTLTLWRQRVLSFHYKMNLKNNA